MSNLGEIKAQYDRASKELDRLAGGNPGTAWRWSIPANPERDSDLILSAPLAAVPKLVAALEAVEKLAEEWRYKGEFGWGAWQEGHGPDPEGHVLDNAASDIRKAITEALA